MKPLYTQAEFDAAKSRDKLPVECIYCKKPFYPIKKTIKSMLDGNKHRTIEYCSNKCHRNHKCPPIIVICEQCKKPFKKWYGNIKRSKHHFCSISCSTKYNNVHKTHGTTVSRLEKLIAEQLITLYPNLEFHFNRKDAINGELDIYIPSLKLAFELNGIFHYEPIHGLDKLNSIQTNDHRKIQACYERGIEICIIDTSSMNQFKPKKAQKFLDIISNIINIRISRNLL